jgi:dephospho-CoA kinase
VVHELYRDPEVHAAVVAHWGPEMAPGGVVDRAAVARRAFATPEDREWLEGFIWPRVGQRIAEWRAIESTRDPAPPALIVEVPLLFESGMESVFDATIAVIADEALREQRAASRGHAAVAERAGRQLSQQEKADKADFAVRNDGSLEELKQTLSRVLAKLDPT